MKINIDMTAEDVHDAILEYLNDKMNINVNKLDVIVGFADTTDLSLNKCSFRVSIEK